MKAFGNLAINRFRLEYLTNMIHCLKTSRRNRAILSDYLNRAATRWDIDEEVLETMSHYQHRFRKSNKDLNGDIDTEVDREMSLGLSERYQREIMQNAHFTDGIQNQINHFVAKVFRTKMNQNTKDRNKTDTDKSNVDSDEPIYYHQNSHIQLNLENSTVPWRQKY